MAPYFSIILPIYNVEQYLKRCVRSVLDQDFDGYEIILVDDGSTDSCPALCDELSRRHNCIRVVHKENGGLSSARNAGLEIAKGQYIWWVDSDDWIEPGALNCLYQATAEKTPDMVKFNYNRVEQKSTAVKSSAQPGFYTGSETEKLQELAFYDPGRFPLSAWSYLYRREFLLSHNLCFISERSIGSEDYLFNLEALLLAQRICVISDVLYDYEQRAGSLTQKYRALLPQKYTKLYLLLRECYEKAGKLAQYEGKICRFYVWHLLHGTCITNEYLVTQDHSLEEGRKNIRAFLRSKECQKAIAHCDKTHLSVKQRLQLLAMRWGMEPVFHWLWKGKRS